MNKKLLVVVVSIVAIGGYSITASSSSFPERKVQAAANEKQTHFDPYNPPKERTINTVPGGIPESRNTEADDLTTNSYAKQLGVSADRARYLLDVQDKAKTGATTATKSYPDEFSMAGVEPLDEGFPISIAFSGSEIPKWVSELFDVNSSEIRLFPNSISVADQQRYRERGIKEGFGFYYEPFERRVTIFTDNPTGPTLEIPSGTEQIIKPWNGVIQRENTASYGGLKVWQNVPPWTETCTTGFGIAYVSQGPGGGLGSGHLNAAHCPDVGPFIINQHSSTAGSETYSAYWDVGIWITGVAAYWTWTGTSGWQDFDSAHTTPVLNQFTCKYGRSSNFGCAPLTHLYYPFAGPVYRHILSGYGISCANGDSGGPVWTSHPSGPASRNDGIITGKNGVGCDYAALDFQLLAPSIPPGFSIL
jgi:hypothetical protein